MNNIRTIVLIAGLLVAGIAFNSIAQTQPSKETETVFADHGKLKHKSKHKPAKDKSHKHEYKPHVKGLKHEKIKNKSGKKLD